MEWKRYPFDPFGCETYLFSDLGIRRLERWKGDGNLWLCLFFFEAFKASSGCVRGNKDELFISIHFEVELFVSDVGGASADITRPQSPC